MTRLSDKSKYSVQFDQTGRFSCDEPMRLSLDRKEQSSFIGYQVGDQMYSHTAPSLSQFQPNS